MNRFLTYATSLLFMCLTMQNSWAQQRPVYSQYMFSGLVLNPAYAGNQQQFVADLIHRDQWVNLEGAPSVQTLSAHSGLKNYPVGVGLLVSRDAIGVHEDFSMYGSYSYKLKIPTGVLAFGLQAGFNFLNSDFRDLNTFDPNDPFFSERLTKFNPNFGFGVFYSNEKAYAGFSIPYLLNNEVYDLETMANTAREARYYFLNGGYIFTLNPVFKLKPSALLRVQEGQPVGMDLNLNLFIDDVVNLGVSHRSSDAINFLMEVYFNKNFSFGYAYDKTLTDIAGFTDGSHEFMLSYRFEIGSNPCHAYF
jgi:type IX secretion system PorP/SprF family membrane protein